MRTTGKSRLTALAVALSAVAARADVPIPAVGQPTPFYGAAGKGVEIEATAAPTELFMDDWLTYTIRVRKLANAADVQRPDLNQIDAFRAVFQIEDLPTEGAEPGGTREFRFRLRPLRVDVAAIPIFTFPYYDPSIAQPPDRPELPFRKARSQAIPLRVTKKSAPPLPPVPLDVPDFAEVPTGPSAVRVPTWVWWVAAAVPPVLAIGGCAVWRAVNPTGARLARRRRSRAVRAALHTLRGLHRHPPADPAAVVSCVAGYLAERFDLPGAYRTPGDLAVRLQEAGADAGTIAECTDFLRFADAIRFGPATTGAAEVLIGNAEQLVRRLEADA